MLVSVTSVTSLNNEIAVTALAMAAWWKMVTIADSCHGNRSSPGMPFSHRSTASEALLL